MIKKYLFEGEFNFDLIHPRVIKKIKGNADFNYVESLSNGTTVPVIELYVYQSNNTTVTIRNHEYEKMYATIAGEESEIEKAKSLLEQLARTSLKEMKGIRGEAA